MELPHNLLQWLNANTKLCCKRIKARAVFVRPRKEGGFGTLTLYLESETLGFSILVLLQKNPVLTFPSHSLHAPVSGGAFALEEKKIYEKRCKNPYAYHRCASTE